MFLKTGTKNETTRKLMSENKANWEGYAELNKLRGGTKKQIKYWKFKCFYKQYSTSKRDATISTQEHI